LNNRFGIGIRNSNLNSIINNLCNYNNEIGISIWLSSNNIARSNIISNNKRGINIKSDSIKNTVFKNNISNNSEVGIFIKFDCINNLIYHNNIISNIKQVVDNGSTNWDNHNEGNFWSDYNGQDNGTNGRVMGNGIGDSNIPHLGLDYYPFVNVTGWLSENRVPEIPYKRIDNEKNNDNQITKPNEVNSDLFLKISLIILSFIIIVTIIFMIWKKKSDNH
jgi:parallel beta-helix repeat protein